MIDQDYMRRAIELAKQGEGWTSPNPLVGAVIVKDGRVIGEGYHARSRRMSCGTECSESLYEPTEGADLYVTLEPCCHYESSHHAWRPLYRLASGESSWVLTIPIRWWPEKESGICGSGGSLWKPMC